MTGCKAPLSIVAGRIARGAFGPFAAGPAFAAASAVDGDWHAFLDWHSYADWPAWLFIASTALLIVALLLKAGATAMSAPELDAEMPTAGDPYLRRIGTMPLEPPTATDLAQYPTPLERAR